MYIPKQFVIEDKGELFSIMKNHSFATLVSTVKGESFATQLPLVIDEKQKCLYGHFARGNEQWKEIEGQKVLAIFQGPHAYISSSWYESNQTVPTWNYISVHVYGKVTVQNELELVHSLQQLVDTYEEVDSSYNLANIKPDTLEGLKRGIVGFKLEIERIEGAAKLSQHHSQERREMVIEKLIEVGTDDAKAIAEAMEKTLEG